MVGIWAVDEFWWVTHRMYAFEQVVSVSFLHVPLLSSSDIRFLRLYVWGGDSDRACRREPAVAPGSPVTAAVDSLELIKKMEIRHTVPIRPLNRPGGNNGTTTERYPRHPNNRTNHSKRPSHLPRYSTYAHGPWPTDRYYDQYNDSPPPSRAVDQESARNTASCPKSVFFY